MLDISNIFSRFTSRLAIAFIAMIWAVVTYPGVNPWIFVAGYGIFAAGYTATKFIQPAAIVKAESLGKLVKPIVTEYGTFNKDDIKGGEGGEKE